MLTRETDLDIRRQEEPLRHQQGIPGSCDTLLYQRMELGLEQLSKSFLRTLAASHPGLRHVKAIRVPDTSVDHSEDLVSTLCRVLLALPGDSLLRFE